jgi:hypothetical protein
MGKVAVEHIFTGPTTGSTTYNSNYTMIGSLIKQYSGATLSNCYISPQPSTMINIPEYGNAAAFMPFVYQYSENIYWVFLAQQVTNTATRFVSLYEFDSVLNTIVFKGFITIGGTLTPGNKTSAALRVYIYKHTTGTVSTAGSSTNIDGNGTLFVDERIASGARIAFGTTASTVNNTWYEIQTINSNTGLTINNSVSLSANTPYIIEEIRVIYLLRSATIVNSGIYLVKGLNYSTFTLGGTNIQEVFSSTADNIRASYLLKDFLTPRTLTVSISNPAIFTLANHGLRVTDSVAFTSPSFPTGLAVNTLYYVTSATTNTFTISTSVGGTPLAVTAGVTTGHTLHSGANLNGMGVGLDEPISFTEHYAYLLNAENATTAVKHTKYNIRASLSGVTAPTPVSFSGGSIGSYVLRTQPLTVVGTPALTNSGRLFTVNHGTSAGIKSIYFTTGSRIYRCTESNIVDNGSGWLNDVMAEVPPGGTSNLVYTTTGALSGVDYSSTIDRLLIPTTTGRLGVYTAEFNPSTVGFDKIFGTNLNRYKFINSPGTDGLFPQASLTIWSEGGYFFAVPNVATSGLNWLFVFPGAVDGFYSNYSNQFVITPKLSTPNAESFYRAYVEHNEYNGTYQLGFPPESYRVYFRTTGIDDNSGAWTELPAGGDLSSYSPSTHIQFKFEFDILGEVCAPAKIYGVTVIYNDFTTDQHYQPSVKYSDYVNKRFAWWFGSAWGSTVPDLRVRLYDANNNNLLVDDNTASPSGTFEKSTDNGSTWGAYNNTDRGNSTTYIRYTPASLADNIKVKFLLTEL